MGKREFEYDLKAVDVQALHDSNRSVFYVQYPLPDAGIRNNLNP
jgi:hypothetical protein